MGIFGRGRDSEIESTSEPPSAIDTATGIDFASYELDELGDDVRSIVDVPGALAQAAKYAVILPFVVAIVTWIVFSSRLAGWVLVPFTLIAFMLSFLASLVLGGFFVARKRLDTVADASGRVVDVIGEMHADVARVRDGHGNTSVQKVAIGLVENVIFPAVFGTLNASAEAAMGPFGRFSSSVTKAPINMVQKSVVSAIEALPDRQIGEIVDQVGQDPPATNADLRGLAASYAGIKERIDGIVARVSRTALGSALGFAAVGAIPLLVWLLIGWAAS